jgi:tetratricopeptide (TPR) repeat protein
MNQNKNSYLLTIYLLIFQASASAFQIPADHLAVAEPAVKGILECRFDDVLRFTDSVYQSDDKNVMAAVMRLAALGMRDVDFDITADAAAFARSFERALAHVYKYETERGVSSYSLTLRGFALAMNASFHLKNGSYLAAASSGIEAIKAMKEARGLDSSNAEANFFLGMYDYAKADLKKRLPPVLFWFPGSKADGIRLLEEGAADAVITRAACALALSDIYLKENHPRRSRDIIFNLKKEMPQSRFVLWAEAKYFEDRKMFSQAADVYGRLAGYYDKEGRSGGYSARYGEFNGIVTRNKRAHMFYKAGETGKATEECYLMLNFYGGGITARDKRAADLMKDTLKLYGILLRLK